MSYTIKERRIIQENLGLSLDQIRQLADSIKAEGIEFSWEKFLDDFLLEHHKRETRGGSVHPPQIDFSSYFHRRADRIDEELKRKHSRIWDPSGLRRSEGYSLERVISGQRTTHNQMIGSLQEYALLLKNK